MEKIEFEIFRDDQRRPTVTVCRIKVNGSTGIGMAIRSLKDNPVEKIGRAKAYGRAKKALYHKKTGLPICRTEAYRSIESVGTLSLEWYKSVYVEG